MRTNKTSRYLAPGLKLYGDEFSDKIRELAIERFGIGHSEKDNNCIYLLIDINGKKEYNRYVDSGQSKMKFFHILSYFKSLDFYVKDYPYDSSKKGHLHIVVFKHPKDLKPFYNNKYSEIYTKEEIDKLFKKGYPSHDIISRTPAGRIAFLKTLNDTYGTTVEEIDIMDHEYDLPLITEQELL